MPILGYSRNLPKNKEKQNKKGWCWQKNQGGNFGHFGELDCTSFMPRNEEKWRFKANIIYYRISLHKN